MAVVVAALALAACSSDGDNGGQAATATTAAVAADRPSSPAKLTIETPRQGQTVKQARPELVLALDGGKVVNQTTTRVQGDEGHIHLYVDGKLVTMNYGLRQRLPQLPPASTSSRPSSSPPTTPPSTPGSSPKPPSRSPDDQHPPVGERSPSPRVGRPVVHSPRAPPRRLTRGLGWWWPVGSSSCWPVRRWAG